MSAEFTDDSSSGEPLSSDDEFHERIDSEEDDSQVISPDSTTSTSRSDHKTFNSLKQAAIGLFRNRSKAVCNPSSSSSKKRAVTVFNDERDEIKPEVTKSLLMGTNYEDFVVKTLRIDDEIAEDKREYLKALFQVVKVNRQINNKKARIYEIDFYNRKVNVYTKSWTLKKSHPAEMVITVEKHVATNLKCSITFLDSTRKSILTFSSPVHRDRFYELALAIKPGYIHYCPMLSLNCKNLIVDFRQDKEYEIRHNLFKEQQQFWKARTIAANAQAAKKRISVGFQSEPDADQYFHEEFMMEADARKSAAKKSLIKGSTAINVSANEFEEIRIFCGTWNVGAAHPPKDYESFGDFIPLGYDIYALSFQEAGYSGGTIEKYITTYLGSGYFSIAKLSLWDIKLMILCNQKHVAKVTSVREARKATGFLNVCGNKGGLGVSFRFNETSLCFIGCHLAAGEEKVEQRAQNVFEIADQLNLGVKELDVTQFHHTFWLGDLNYRIDMPFEITIDLAESRMYSDLLANDQLRKQMEKGNVFTNFKESAISFPPSYKYDLGSRRYTRKKYRPPSWCDRVLVHSLPECEIETTSYSCANTILTSDHSPVFGIFKLNTRLNYLSIFSPKEMNREIVFSKVYMVGRNGPKIYKPRLSFFGTWMVTSPVHCDNLVKTVVTVSSGDNLSSPQQQQHTKRKKSTVEAEQQQQKILQEQKVAALVNPFFQDSEMPALIPTISNLEFLKHQHVHLLVSDRAIEIGDRGVCLGVLSLQSICESLDEDGYSPWIKFNIPLTSNTALIGRLHGQIKLQPRFD